MVSAASTLPQQPAPAAPGPVPTPPPTVPAFPGIPSDPAANPLFSPLRNPLLSPGPGGAPGGPVTGPAARQKIDKFVQKVLDPETTLDLVAGQTRVLILKSNPFRVQAGDEKYIAVNVANPKELLVEGRQVGSTVLNLWFGDPADMTKQETLSYLVRVYPDPEAKERLERAYKALENDINNYFKDCSVHLKVVGDKLVVSGRVRDTVQGTQILRIVHAGGLGTSGSAGGGGGAGGAAGPGGFGGMPGGDAGRVPLQQTGVLDPLTGGITTAGLDLFRATGGNNVINLLEVAGEQQVMLRVIVAEVNRAAARSIGLNFNINNNQGLTVFGLNNGSATAGLGTATGAGGLGLTGSGLNGSGSGGNITLNLDAGKIPIAITALKTLSYAKSLAEPTLVTMNGYPASFLAGGQFPVPVIGGLGTTTGGLGGLQGVQYIPYGVSLFFTPYITDRDRIRLNLSATVSNRDVSSGATIGGAVTAGLTTRNVNTTLELRQGETLAVAGLIEADQGGGSSRVPFFGDLPVLGILTASNQVSAGEKELVIFITPDLVRPLDPGQRPPLPGTDMLDPSDLEFYVLNRLEGHCKDFRSPIRTDWSRLKQYHQIEQSYITGQWGYTDPPFTGERP
ncbi:Type II/IV secretion system secretin RcpA/CpaC, associated with Flp pilus assembly [Fimbriiglobus ruber]|uniref:Type II/IV secretion system secretin RcpA/CpaC, associated with Flp pilus assembly n=2 Tax=Fimbriiglobus ruber TaxID=1908690 RepID=A0A225E4G8_9BACT|nr:Type II/IV secretion system secretin RcpA/CpaC, associated with Flp pilus assembly [Fimbriiglobus ruber]